MLSFLKNLVSIANHFDKKKLTVEADIIDRVISKISLAAEEGRGSGAFFGGNVSFIHGKTNFHMVLPKNALMVWKDGSIKLRLSAKDKIIFRQLAGGRYHDITEDSSGVGVAITDVNIKPLKVGSDVLMTLKVSVGTSASTIDITRENILNSLGPSYKEALSSALGGLPDKKLGPEGTENLTEGNYLGNIGQGQIPIKGFAQWYLSGDRQNVIVYKIVVNGDHHHYQDGRWVANKEQGKWKISGNNVASVGKTINMSVQLKEWAKEQIPATLSFNTEDIRS